MGSPIQRLTWNDTQGDAADDEVIEAQENPDDPESDVWQIASHDGGPSFNWMRLDCDGDVIDIGTGCGSIDEAKNKIEERRR